jgi:hypothetical protein
MLSTSTSTAYPSAHKQAVVLSLLREMHILVYNTGTIVLHCATNIKEEKKTHCCIYSGTEKKNALLHILRKKKGQQIKRIAAYRDGQNDSKTTLLHI